MLKIGNTIKIINNTLNNNNMNILLINNGDCSEQAAGGVNRVVFATTRIFMELYNYNCYLGFFRTVQAGCLPADFAGRIRLYSNFREQEFENFLLENKINIIQVNFLAKKYLYTIPQMYKIAHRNGIKFIYELHEFPGFEAETYGTFDRVKFSLRNKKDFKLEFYRWLISSLKPIIRPVTDLLIRKKYRMPYENSDKVVLLSQFYKEDYMRISGLKDSSKFTAIGNGLPFNLKISEDEILKKNKEILVVQRFDDFSKRVSLVLKIWNLVEKNPSLVDWKLTLVGDGPSMPYYRYLTKKLNLQRVTFTGHQYPVEYYRNASIFLMTSSIEGWPMVLMEALQMGLPLIAFDSFGALHDIIQDGYNGKLIPNNDINSFYQYLSFLMLNDEKRLQMNFNALEASRNFEMDVFINKWVKLFHNILHE